MKEEKFIELIKSVAGDKYIGDDCAYLKDLGIVVSQDNLVENVHFDLKYMSPYQLGYKSAMVNISDIAASGGCCKYMSVGLSVPSNTTDDFILEFYKGLNNAISECNNIEIIGGDITGSTIITVSIAIIGTIQNRRISSRANAKTSQVIVVSGEHGSSAGGLKLLLNNENKSDALIRAHIMPKAQVDFSKIIAENIEDDYAMTDSSDGLADSLYKIAQASNKTLKIDFDKVIYNPELKSLFPNIYKELILYGGEDYQLVATVPKDFAAKYNLPVIGEVVDRIKDNPVIVENYSYNKTVIKDLEGCFNHFSD